MGFVVKVLLGLLICVALSSAVGTFPYLRGKTLTYRYYADVKLGTLKPVQYASYFALDGHVLVTHDSSDPTTNYAYIVTLKDIKHTLFNGQMTLWQKIETFHEMSEASKMIHDPFVVVFDERGKVQGVKIATSECGWSKNIKQAIASLMQLDMSSIMPQSEMKPHGFITTENTIHGNCQVAYDVQLVPENKWDLNGEIKVTKSYDMRNCTEYMQRVFDSKMGDICHVPKEDPITTMTSRQYDLKNTADGYVVKMIAGYGQMFYSPWQANSENHYFASSQTLWLESVKNTDAQQSSVNVRNVPVTNGVTYQKPEENYVPHAGEDLTQGRRVVKVESLMPKLKKMLEEAADYFAENHIETKEPDWKHGQTINRLLNTMGYMDVGLFESVFTSLQDGQTPREETIRNIFLMMVPHVGTSASCIFIRNVIRKQKVSTKMAFHMLSLLPHNVRVPSERLLLDMEDLLKLDNSVNVEVRKASILCFATLINRTFKHLQGEPINPLLNRYLQHFFDHVKNEPTYEMKMVYVMAMRNVEVGNIHQLLAPIIRGERMLSEKPVHLRHMAMLAVSKSVIGDMDFVHDLFWPIMADNTLPVHLRITAYTILMDQMPDMARMMRIHWYMVNEKDQNLYNFHYTTLKSLANSVDPCMQPVKEMVQKILESKVEWHSDIFLSSNIITNYMDSVYGYGETMKIMATVNQLTGIPYTGIIEHVSITSRKPVSRWGVYWSVEGMDDILKNIVFEKVMSTLETVSNENVNNLLKLAAKDMPQHKDMHVEVCFMMHDHVIFAGQYDKDNWKKFFQDYGIWMEFQQNMNVNWQHVQYDELYEAHVPTDLGVPMVMATRIPSVTSLKLNAQMTEEKPSINVKLNTVMQTWRHGHYSISVYNPIADVWHSVERMFASDVMMPVEGSVSFAANTKSLKIILPRLMHTESPQKTGMISHVKNYVTVTEDETNALKRSCPTCHHHEVITAGPTEKKYHQTTFESKDTGLLYSMAIFDCENGVTPVTHMKDWLRAMSSSHKNTWNIPFVHGIMALRQQMTHYMISPEIGSCGYMMKMETSAVHPISHIEIGLRASMEDVKQPDTAMYLLNGMLLNIRGTVDVKAAVTNASIRHWDINVSGDMSEGHTRNNLKVRITRTTPGEKDLKICVDGQMNYPIVTKEDVMKIDTVKEEIAGKLTFSMGMADDDKCVRDDTTVSITVKGEMSDEQKKQLNHDSVHGRCMYDMKNAKYRGTHDVVPRTNECLKEAITYTTMRKYTMNMAYKKIPQSHMSNVYSIMDKMHAMWLPHIEYSASQIEPGNVKMIMQYPPMTHDVDVKMMTPLYTLDYTALPYGHPVWNGYMFNTRFSNTFLHKYMNEHSKICSVYPQVVITADNGAIDYTLTNKWTLMAGHYIHNYFAIFVRATEGNKVAVKIYVKAHHMEITPTESNVIVKIDDQIVGSHQNNTIFPPGTPDDYIFRIVGTNRKMVQSHGLPILLEWTWNGVTLLMDTILRGHVTGICGHMDGTHQEKLPKVYMLAEM
ncbi:uncharacterized protein LOC105696201 [Orussus abietinus]|uniref:uncharacterized protein LOC105696201 n=1 Tax=Orussus abietinus TaxID=222816 RepID=UPI0006265855|nr:uncharacterized protein LOC105696201 [Orussus abietinus]